MKRIFKENPKDHWVDDEIYDEVVQTLEEWDKQEEQCINFLRGKIKSEESNGRNRDTVSEFSEPNKNQE